MRDPQRIDPIIERIRAVWHKHPDMRIAQIISAAAKFGPGIPVHLIEDDVLIKAIEEVMW